MIEELLQKPYWIIDILPEQVPKDSPGRYFAVEKYFLEGERLAQLRQKHTDLILKLYCYRNVAIAEEDEIIENPSPESIAEEMNRRYLYILVDGALIISEPNDTHMTVFRADEELLGLIRTLAAGEGLFVWRPPEL